MAKLVFGDDYGADFEIIGMACRVFTNRSSTIMECGDGTAQDRYWRYPEA